MSELLDFIEHHNPQPYLPLMHVTKADIFARYLCKSEKLEPRECPVFGEPLLYFFYGRPAYKIDNKNIVITDEYLFPVCFIIDSSNVGKVKRIFPFDTGAFYNDLYNEHFNTLDKKIDNKEKLKECESYCLGENMDTPAKFVSAFFGSNERYLTGAFKKDLEFDYFTPTLHKYYSLLCETGKPLSDDRKYSVEIQLENEVALPNNLLAIVIPSKANDKPEVRNLLKKWNTIGLPYYSISSPQTGTLNGALFNEVARYLKLNNYI